MEDDVQPFQFKINKIPYKSLHVDAPKGRLYGKAAPAA
jgi:hypothetical protein